MKAVGIILCRKGSKGVPGKNTKLINNRPMFTYQVGNLKKAGVKEVYVSTNDKIIDMLSYNYDFRAIERPEVMCKDTAKCEEALKHFADIVDFDIMVFAQATSPMCPPKYIKKGISLVKTGKCDSVVSVTEEHWLPRWSKNMKPIDWKTSKRPRRQERESVYVENGAFYITTRNAFIKSGIRYSGKIEPIVMPLYDSFQIDTHDDFELIKKLMRK